MVTAKSSLTFRSTLTKEAKKGIELSPLLIEAVKKCMESGKDAVVRDHDGELFVIQPQHPVVEGGKGYLDWESVYIMLITGFTSYRVPKGSFDYKGGSPL